jgi:hypothetical protein
VGKKDLVMTYNEKNFIIQPQDKLATSTTIIDVPNYIQNTGSIKGIYARIPQEKFQQSLRMIQDVF